MCYLLSLSFFRLLSSCRFLPVTKKGPRPAPYRRQGRFQTKQTLSPLTPETAKLKEASTQIILLAQCGNARSRDRTATH